MGAIRASYILARHGFDREKFIALCRLASTHEGYRGGQHTNGGCHDGRCDFGSPACAAWTELCDIIEHNLREPEPSK